MTIRILLLLGLLLSACSRSSAPPRPEPLPSCLPETEPEGNLRIAISSFSRGTDKTRVRIVAYAGTEPADFALPVYYMSRGRWTVDEDYRAYLLDSDCREYKLLDRHDAAGTDAPPDGKMKLKAGASFETTLDFPSLPAKTRNGVLVYGRRIIPFFVLPSTPASSVSPGAESK
ncbi:MAG: hypothetical protein ABI882_01875 [Acidobacteriota bacterium]